MLIVNDILRLNLVFLSWPEIADIWARTSKRGFLRESKEQRNNMAARERSVPKVDYKELNALSSVVLFNTSTRKVKGRKIYNVERIIERRKAKYVRFPQFFIVLWVLYGWNLTGINLCIQALCVD